MGKKKKKEEIKLDLNYETNGKFYCPNCGCEMERIDTSNELECLNCGAEGTREYDSYSGLYFVDIAQEYSFEEIYSDPENNKPACCDACGGPYPNCLVSCKIFDD